MTYPCLKACKKHKVINCLDFFPRENNTHSEENFLIYHTIKHKDTTGLKFH